MPSFILIRPTVWPQCTNVTDRTGQTGLRTDSIGRTVLQMVAQKLHRPFAAIQSSPVSNLWMHSIRVQLWAYLRTTWHLDPSTACHNRHWPKIGDWSCCATFCGRGTGSPSNTMSPGPRPTSVPSGILTPLAIRHSRHGRKIGGCAPFWR